MMLRQLFTINYKTPFIIASSGGVDSMALLDFYKRGNKNFQAAYFNHGTPQANHMQHHLSTWCKANNVNLLVGYLTEANRPKELSPEEYWRNKRYEWLLSYNLPVITAHHL